MDRIRDKTDLLLVVDNYTDSKRESQKDWIITKIRTEIDYRVYRVSPGPGMSILMEFYAGSDIDKCAPLMYRLIDVVGVPIYTYFNGVYIVMNGGK